MDVKKPAKDLFIDPLEGNFDGLNFLADQNMSVVNRKAMEGTILAHTDGGVPEVLVEVDDLSAYNVGYLIYFLSLIHIFTVRALFTSLPVSTEAGRFLMVSTPVSLVTSPVTVPL